MMRTKEEMLQAIAEICGELSLGASGIREYRAFFPAWKDEHDRELEGPAVITVPPEKVEGIFEAIHDRLQDHPDYQPLKLERERADRYRHEIADLQAQLQRQRELIAGLQEELNKAYK